MDSGYGKTPLYKKLGLKEGHQVFLHKAPTPFTTYLSRASSITIVNKPSPKSVDYAHLFCLDYQSLVTSFDLGKRIIKENGMLWISWPKKSSGLYKDLSRDIIREYGLANGLVDVKIASIDEDWSALKFVYYLKNRAKK